MKNLNANLKLVIAAHFLWVLLGAISLPLLFIFDWYKYIVWTFLGATVMSWITWRGCVLRIWENDLRKATNPSSVYEGTFLSYYIKKIFGVKISSTAVRIIIYSFLVMLLLASVFYK
jgi:hypothetical protein